MRPELWWFVTRASGIVAGVLLALTVIWGLLVSSKALERVTARRGLPAWSTDLHRGLGGLTVAFVVLHLLALVADSHEHFGWAELFVPFASAWRRGPVAWGVLAWWLLVAVEASSLLRRRLGRRAWFGLHLLAYPAAVLAGVHALTAGSDADHAAYRWVQLGLLVVATYLVVFRVVQGRPPRRAVVVRSRAPAVPAAAPPAAPQHEVGT